MAVRIVEDRSTDSEPDWQQSTGSSQAGGRSRADRSLPVGRDRGRRRADGRRDGCATASCTSAAGGAASRSSRTTWTASWTTRCAPACSPPSACPRRPGPASARSASSRSGLRPGGAARSSWGSRTGASESRFSVLPHLGSLDHPTPVWPALSPRQRRRVPAARGRGLPDGRPHRVPELQRARGLHRSTPRSSELSTPLRAQALGLLRGPRLVQRAERRRGALPAGNRVPIAGGRRPACSGPGHRHRRPLRG